MVLNRQLIPILVLVTIAGCQGSENTESELARFNTALGEDKASALDRTAASFDDFLRLNYSDRKNQQERAIAFLEQIHKGARPDTNWRIDTKGNEEILRDFESSGLRPEIWLYGYELDSAMDNHLSLARGSQDSSEQSSDSSSYFNTHGLFLISLDESVKTDSLTRAYINARQIGNMSYEHLAGGLLANGLNYENPIHRRIMVVDFYLDIMLWNQERTRRMNEMSFD